jgi:hypothetical protein
MKYCQWIVTVGLALVLAPCVIADLVFEKTRIEIVAKPDQDQVEAVFKFENQGTTEARIVSVSSGCQCLSAKAAAELIAPNGSSEITGVFKVGNFPGINQKSIQVRVSQDGKDHNLALTVSVELKELINIEPKTLTWSSGDSAAKTFTVTMNGEEPIRLQEVECSRPGFDIRMETIKEGAEYKVHVTPQDSANPSLGVFRFKTDCKHPRFANPAAFGHVKKS